MKTFPACSGSCEQGKKLCPCPQACQVTEQQLDDLGAGIVRWVLVGLAVWFALAGIAVAVHLSGQA